jgi:hypothetical protein
LEIGVKMMTNEEIKENLKLHNFKVGSKVKVIGCETEYLHWSYIGKYGYITEIDITGAVVDFGRDFGKNDHKYIYINEMELYDSASSEELLESKTDCQPGLNMADYCSCGSDDTSPNEAYGKVFTFCNSCRKERL